MSGVAPEAIALSLVLGVLLGLVFAAVEAVRALFSLGRIATAQQLGQSLCNRSSQTAELSCYCNNILLHCLTPCSDMIS